MSGSDEGDDGNDFQVTIERLENYQFKISFDKDGMEDLLTDETEEVGGEEEGPNPSRLLAASVLNCLSASLTFCLNKKRLDISSLKGEVTGKTERIDGRLRVTDLNVNINPVLADAADEEKLKQCIDIFEDYCVVTQSVRRGIDIEVEVEV